LCTTEMLRNMVRQSCVNMSYFSGSGGDITKINRDLENITERISSSNNIVVMAGAGLSTASGIPDFRSPNTGIYSNLSKFNLPYPEAIFELEYFKQNPKPFNTWAKEFFPGVNYLPNKGHYFIKLLEEKGKLSRYYTQNVDGLDNLVQITPEKMIEAHGTFSSASCVNCKKSYPVERLKEDLLNDITSTCPSCKGYIKPDLVFFGEALPKRFFDEAEMDCLFADLLICIGTSLEVYPFAGIVDAPRHDTARLLINNDLVGSFGARPNDSALLGDIELSVTSICNKLDWTDDIQELQLENEMRMNDL